MSAQAVEALLAELQGEVEQRHRDVAEQLAGPPDELRYRAQRAMDRLVGARRMLEAVQAPGPRAAAVPDEDEIERIGRAAMHGPFSAARPGEALPERAAVLKTLEAVRAPGAPRAASTPEDRERAARKLEALGWMSPAAKLRAGARPDKIRLRILDAFPEGEELPEAVRQAAAMLARL